MLDAEAPTAASIAAAMTTERKPRLLTPLICRRLYLADGTLAALSSTADSTVFDGQKPMATCMMWDGSSSARDMPLPRLGARSR